MTVRKIIHIDMDAFFAAVEQRDNPAYQGIPLAVGGRAENRGVIATASYEARAYGVRSAMATKQAFTRCPHLTLVPGRFHAYREVSEQIHAIFKDYTDLIEPLSLDEAYLDVSEALRPQQSATQLAQEIQQRILKKTQLTASAGVSYNKFLAKVASDYKKPQGLFVVPPQHGAAFAAQLPIGRFYGIGRKTEARLQGIGIRTGKDLKNLSMEALISIFGKSAAFFYGLACGEDTRPVETQWIRKSIGAEHTFPQDLFETEDMIAALYPLAEEVFAWMQRHRSFGRTLTLKVKYADFQSITRSVSQPQPITKLSTALEHLERLLTRTEATQKGVRLLGVSFSNLNTPSKSSGCINHALTEEQLKLPIAT